MGKQTKFDSSFDDIDPVMEDAFSAFDEEEEDEIEDTKVGSREPAEQLVLTPQEDSEPDFGEVSEGAPVQDLTPDSVSEPVSAPVSTDHVPDLGDTQLELGSSEKSVADIQFPNLTEQESGSGFETELFSNIPVNLSVELGRSQITLKEVFELSEGSIVELDRLVGEPLDLVVNGQVIAQGEVVAIDNSYGLRIASIVAKYQR